MTVATFFTCLRIALVPLFGWLWATAHYADALAIFVIAAVSDLLDGLLARTLDQKSRLGALLDPAADKLMLLVSFLVAASVGAVPWWLAAVVIGRDAVLVTGLAVLTFAFHPRVDTSRFGPTRIGKYSTFFQLGTIGLALVTRALGAEAPRAWIAALVYAACLFTVGSALQYTGSAMVALRRRAAARAPLAPLSHGRPDPRTLA